MNKKCKVLKKSRDERQAKQTNGSDLSESLKGICSKIYVELEFLREKSDRKPNGLVSFWKVSKPKELIEGKKDNVVK